LAINIVFRPPLAERLLHYTKGIRDIVSHFRNTISLLNEVKASEARSELAKAIKKDTEADHVRREIAETHIYNIEDPDLREIVLKFLRMLDRISEWTKEAARYLDLIPYLEIPDELRKHIEELSRLSLEGIEYILMSIQALMENDIERALNYCKHVEEIEETADGITHTARKNLVVYGRKIDNPAVIVMLRDFIESLENITDYEEDASDLIRVIISRITKK